MSNEGAFVRMKILIYHAKAIFYNAVNWNKRPLGMRNLVLKGSNGTLKMNELNSYTFPVTMSQYFLYNFLFILIITYIFHISLLTKLCILRLFHPCLIPVLLILYVQIALGNGLLLISISDVSNVSVCEFVGGVFLVEWCV